MEQENTKVKAANAVEASIKSQSSEIEKQKSAQVKSKFAKKATASDTKKGKNALQVRKQIRKKKIRVLEGNIKTINNEQDGKKLTSKEESDVKNATNKERCENNEEKTSESNKKQKKHKAEKKLDGPENSTKNNQEQDGKKLISREESQQKIATGKEGTEKNEEKNRESSKSSKKLRAAKKHVEPEKSSRNLNIKEKRNGMERSENDKREKLGGLIFMCSAKTKPDCFRYRVMGVSMSKKDIVLSIKPGLKIFLYDFDLRLMYGIYQASSSGGMKLEPEAFGGAFPVQVRFSVHSDCYPLSESTFKRAIKENYNERQKFKTELTVKQVRKLMDLFRPAALHSTALPIRSPPSSTIRDRDAYEGARESRRNSSREKFTRDPYANGDARGYPVSSHGRDQHIEYGAVASTHRDENTHSLYLTEKEYRAYGLQGERKNLAHPHQGHHIVPSMETLQSGHEREYVLRQPDPVHPHTVPLSREAIIVDPVYLTEREYLTYNAGARRELPYPVPTAVATASAAPLDTYPSNLHPSFYYVDSSADPYQPPSRREEVPSGPYYVGGRRETYPIQTDQEDRLYSTYAADALSDYTQTHQYQGPKSEAGAAPVSSRYSFAGPSMSYR